MSNFIHPFSGYFIFLLFTHRFFFPCLITHGHGDVKYAHYSLNFYVDNANHTVGSFEKLLRDLEKPPVHSFRALLMVVEQQSFMRQCLRGRRFVCCHCQNHPENPFVQNHYL